MLVIASALQSALFETNKYEVITPVVAASTPRASDSVVLRFSMDIPDPGRASILLDHQNVAIAPIITAA
jgi:hypothetical protein